MKKRIFMLALVVGVLLSFSASAWATDETHIFFKLEGISNVSKDTDAESVTTISFDVSTKWEVASNDDTSAKSTPTDFTDGWYKNANLAKWTLGGSSNAFTAKSYAVTTTATEGTRSYGVTSSDPYFLMTPTSNGTDPGSSGTYTFKVVAKGTLQYPGEDCQIRVSLYNAADSSSILTTYTSSTEVAEVDGAEIASNADPIDYDTRNPDGYAWDGLAPTFSNTISGDTDVYDKAKPKLGKIEKADLTFKAGKSDDLEVPLVGPITLVDVYIAGKDAVKLWPDKWTDKNKNIQLTKENIKEYNIPFRVTDYDFATSVSGSDAKTIKKNWKSAANTLTLSFNGGNYALKGYPITIAMSNTNNSDKPVAKAVKLNVEPNTIQATWLYPEKKLISGDTVRVLKSGDIITASSDTSFWYAVDDDGTIYNDAAFTLASVDNWTYTKPSAADGYVKIIGSNWIVSGEQIEDKTRIAVLSVDIESADYKLSDTNKLTKTDDKGKVTLPVKISSGSDGTIPSYAVYIVSADGPYTVTAKGDKDDVKTNVVQASFDYLGNVTAPATVTISGKVKTDKETKTGITLTAQNPSTKKKGALKVTVQGTLAPYYDTAKSVETKTKVIDEVSYTRNYLKGVKRVVVGKAPSAKFKAKGTKTITYRLATDDDDIDDGYVPDDVATALSAVGLSFDSKKGIFAPDKTKLTVPTAGETDDGDTELQSIDICVIAENGVGSTPLFAELAIAGAKPSIKKDDKKITIPSSARKGARIPFRLVAGKTDVNSDTELTTANVKVSLASGTVPSGIALQSWTSMDCVVSACKTLASGDTITVSTDTAWTLALLSTDKKTVSGDYMSATDATNNGYAVQDSSNYKAQFANGVSVKIGNTTEKDVDSDYQNTGVFVVTSNTREANTKGAKLNLTLENLGTTAKGAITVVIEAASGDENVYSTTTSTATTANAEGAKAAAKANVKSGHGYAPADETALEAEEAEETTEAEAKVTFGPARTADSLSAAQQAFLADNGYTVVAVLPEATAEADGQYDFEVVDLNENAPKGAKLVWLAFPKDGSYSEDDEIADFYDEAGEPIENVPASLKVKVSAWLRAGVTYEPVIAVKD